MKSRRGRIEEEEEDEVKDGDACMVLFIPLCDV